MDTVCSIVSNKRCSGSENNLVELIQRLKDELKAQSLSNGQMKRDGSEQSAVMTDLDFRFV